MSICADCNNKFSLDDGGFLWQGLVFCENCDPEGCPENCDDCLEHNCQQD